MKQPKRVERVFIGEGRIDFVNFGFAVELNSKKGLRQQFKNIRKFQPNMDYLGKQVKLYAEIIPVNKRGK